MDNRSSGIPSLTHDLSDLLSLHITTSICLPTGTGARLGGIDYLRLRGWSWLLYVIS